MYGGVGIMTPKGSGTNGYVQRNLSFLPRQRLDFQAQIGQSFKSMTGENAIKVRKANNELLIHEQKRKVENELLKLEDELLSAGMPESEVQAAVGRERKHMLRAVEDGALRYDSELEKASSHQQALEKEKELFRFEKAVGIDTRGRVVGAAFDQELQAQLKLERMQQKAEQEQARLEAQKKAEKAQKRAEELRKKAEKAKKKAEAKLEKLKAKQEKQRVKEEQKAAKLKEELHEAADAAVKAEEEEELKKPKPKQDLRVKKEVKEDTREERQRDARGRSDSRDARYRGGRDRSYSRERGQREERREDRGERRDRRDREPRAPARELRRGRSESSCSSSEGSSSDSSSGSESSAKPRARKDRDRGQTARNAETHCPHALSKQKCWLKQELWIPGRCQRQRGGWERMFDVNRKQECVLLYCAVAGRQRGSQEEKGGRCPSTCKEAEIRG
ncbi:unnamed protein product [Durusdinium trenchii]|uniref:CWF21 domain-containing protein n=1 Tax=Durusdinium trenchii TaxID=1381693 RepID=A0ABP0JX52_9DINO